MTSMIKTGIAERLRFLLNLVNTPDNLKLIHTVQPVIEYQTAMTKKRSLSITGTAGNVAITIENTPGLFTKILYGRIKIVADANAADRKPYIQIRSGFGAVPGMMNTEAVTATIANQTKYYYVSDKDYVTATSTPIHDDNLGLMLVPHSIHDIDYIQIGITGGLAGDTWDLIAKLEEAPETKDWDKL